MKNLKTAIIATIVTALIIVSCAHAVPANAEDENVYQFPAIVTGIDFVKDVVTIVDDHGEEWEFYGAEEWSVGNLVWVIVYSYGTETLEDDEIIDIEFQGVCDYQFLYWWLTK